LEVDGKDARDWSSEEVSKNVAAIGSIGRMKIERAGEAVPLNIKILRDAVPLPSIRSFLITPGTGYIDWSVDFNTRPMTNCARITNLKKQGMRQLVWICGITRRTSRSGD
jgi:C-terminal processing protease CtpA/Prc